MATLVSFITDGSKTLSKICELGNYDINNVLQINEDIKDYLLGFHMKGLVIPPGTEIKVPSDGYSNVIKLYETDGTSKLGLYVGTTLNYSTGYLRKSTSRIINGNYFEYEDSSYLGLDQSSHLDLGWSHKLPEGDCKFIILTGNEEVVSYNLPVYPNEFSETNSAQFSPVSILGRSVDYEIYNGSSRSLSLNLILHEELCNNYDELNKIVSAIESACYPDYSESSSVRPPEVIFYIAKFKSIRGILESVQTNWKAPIIDGRLVNCEVSFSIKETNGPYSRKQVAAMKGLRTN